MNNFFLLSNAKENEFLIWEVNNGWNQNKSSFNYFRQSLLQRIKIAQTNLLVKYKQTIDAWIVKFFVVIAALP